MPTSRALAVRKRLAGAFVGPIVSAGLVLSPVAPGAIAAEAMDAPEATAAAQGELLGGGNDGARYRYRGSEKCFMRKINKARASYGQRRLNWDKQLGYVARRHAHVMANRGGVWHDQNLGRRVTRWRSLGQNTGAGGKCRRLFRSFMNSAPHRANILGRWRFIGVGAKWRNHRLYVQTIFETRRNPGNVWSWP